LLGESFSGGPLTGLSVTNGYDQYLRRTNLTALAASLLSQTTYGYDNASRLLTVNDGNNDVATYNYLSWVKQTRTNSVVSKAGHVWLKRS